VKRILLLTAVLSSLAWAQSSTLPIRFDTGFAQKGMLELNTIKTPLTVFDLQILPDNKIMVFANTTDKKSVLVIKKYLANGTPDLRFGSKGMAALPGNTALSASPYANGDWLLLREENMLQRISSTGKPVLGFGQKSFLRIPTPKGYSFEKVFVNPETSSITLAGMLEAPPSDQGHTFNALASARLTAAGKLDSKYGLSGVNHTAFDMVGGIWEARQLGSSISVFGGRPPGTNFGAVEFFEARFDQKGDLSLVHPFSYSYAGLNLAVHNNEMVFATNGNNPSKSRFRLGGNEIDSQWLNTDQWPALRTPPDSAIMDFGVTELLSLSSLDGFENSLLVFGYIKNREKPLVLRVALENTDDGDTEWKANETFGKDGAFEFPKAGYVSMAQAFEGGAYAITVSDQKDPVRLWKLRF
jgi:hypothetical protein